MRNASARGKALAASTAALWCGAVVAAPAAAATIAGTVYDAVSHKPVAGVSLTLVYDETDASDRAVPVPASALGTADQQGQTTGADGRYRFDVSAGRKYRLHVAVDRVPYAFPSRLIPPQLSFAKVGASGQVVPHHTANDSPAQDNTYYLRFAISGPQEQFDNNHVALDPLSAAIAVSKRADRPTARRGDTVHYTVELFNRSARSLQGISLLDVPAAGLSYLPDQFAAADSAGRALAGLSALVKTDGARRLIRFGPLDLAPGQRLTLRYGLAVEPEATPGLYGNRALVAAAQGVQLSAAAIASVRILPVPALASGGVFGRVFCDSNGNGRHDDEEPVVAGARVYLEGGADAVTDSAGRYQLAKVMAGTHIVRVDAATLAAGRAAAPSPRWLRITGEQRAEADFPVRCGLGSARRADPSRELISAPGAPPRPQAGAPPGRSATISLAGDVGAFRLSVVNRPVVLPKADIEFLTVRRRPRAPAGGYPPDEGFGWRTRCSFPHGVLTASWQLVVASAGDANRAAVRTVRGSGSPPPELEWDGRGDDGNPVDPGLYSVQLTVFGDRLRAEAASPRWTVAVVPERVSQPGKKVLRTRQLFAGTSRSPTPTRELAQLVGDIAAQVEPEDEITIESHWHGSGDRLEALTRTQREASLVKDLLVKAGVSAARITARGRGALEPLEPAETPAARRANRRLVVEVKAGGGAAAELASVHLQLANVLVDSQPVNLTGDLTFAWVGRLPGRGAVLVDMEASDGRRAAMEIKRRAAPPEPRPAAPAPRPISIRGNLQTGEYWVGPTKLDSALLAIDARLDEEDEAALAAGARRPRASKPLTFALRVPPALQIASWRLAVGNDGAPGDRDIAAGEGAPPPAAQWDGADGAGASLLVPGGRYLYRLHVRTQDGARASSPPRTLAVRQSAAADPALLSVRGRLFGPNGNPSAYLRNQLSTQLAARLAKGGAAERYIISLRVRGEPDMSATESHLHAAARAVTLRRYLRLLKVDDDRYTLRTRSGRGGRDALTIRAVAPPSNPPPQLRAPAEPRLRIDGTAHELSGDQFDIPFSVLPGGAVVVEITAASEHRASFVVVPIPAPAQRAAAR